MTADLVNLRRARKAKVRADAADVATANRAKFGRSSAERDLAAARSALTARRLEDHRLDAHRIEDSASRMPIEPEAAIAKHSLLVAGHQTSISLEAIFWDALKREATRRAVSVAALVAEIDAERGDANLSSAIRVDLFRRLLAAAPSHERR